MPQLISSSKWYEKERMLRLLEFFGRVADGLRPPLLALPLDLFVKIVSLLHLEDIAALGHVSFQVMCMLQNDVVAHDIVKVRRPNREYYWADVWAKYSSLSPIPERRS